MRMFEYKYKVPKKEIGTTYGSISIKNIIFEPGEIEKVLPDIVFDDENLKHMFAEENLNDFKRRNIYRRFIPKTKVPSEIEQFIKESIQTNVSFYSFLAEGILGLIFRDLYDYKLAKGVIDINDTLVDSHTGVDACMYDMENSAIVLGEAKFYGSLDSGMNRIINDFVKKNIKNKLESLQIATENCPQSHKIVIKNLSLDEYDEITVEQFINQKIIFAGFVLHSEQDISNYGKQEFYNKYTISVQKLANNINKHLKVDCIKGEYEIIMLHLPIRDKKTLISKIIETSQIKLSEMKNNI